MNIIYYTLIVPFYCALSEPSFNSGWRWQLEIVLYPQQMSAEEENKGHMFPIEATVEMSRLKREFRN